MRRWIRTRNAGILWIAVAVALTEVAHPNLVLADAVRFASFDPQPEFRGFWADAFGSGFKSTTQINSMVARAVEGNYNAIVAEVMAYQDDAGSAHGAFWKSDILPWAPAVTASFDPLAYLCQRAHAHGIEVHAWIVSFRVSSAWPPSGNSHVRPEWLMVEQGAMGGGPSPVGGFYTLDPGSPDVQEYLMSIVRELVTEYEIDGVNWDYIRYVQANAGYPADTSYDKSTLARFQQITGTVGTPPYSGDADWNDFRRRTINEVVRRGRAEVASITTNPRQPLRHTADLFCPGGAPANFASSSAYALFQDWRRWMEMGWLDAGMPMNYKREHNATEASMYRSWIDAAVDDWRYDRHMYCGQGNYLNTKANSVSQLDYVYAAGADGSMNYSYYRTADENMNGSPETDWTWYGHVATNRFTSPAPLPEMPWRDPASANEGTIWGRVTDQDAGQPIDDATVEIQGAYDVQTDGNGYYVATLIPGSGSPYTVTASFPGKPDRVHEVAVLVGDVVRQDFSLGTIPGDMNHDGQVDLADFPMFAFCLNGPATNYTLGHFCLDGDADADRDVDLADFDAFAQSFVD
jgi:uncharacterized lipoprotein YddW (UPF0748 family)